MQIFALFKEYNHFPLNTWYTFSRSMARIQQKKLPIHYKKTRTEGVVPLIFRRYSPQEYWLFWRYVFVMWNHTLTRVQSIWDEWTPIPSSTIRLTGWDERNSQRKRYKVSCPSIGPKWNHIWVTDSTGFRQCYLLKRFESAGLFMCDGKFCAPENS